MLRWLVGVCGAACACATTATAAPATPATPKAKPRADSHFEAPADPDAMPAVRYGAMDQAACEAELDARHVSYERETAVGVAEPVRLTGPLHGVTFRTDEPDSKLATTPYGISDCRLLLALDDFSEILAAHSVVEVRHYSMYRRPDKSWPADKVGKQHIGGLAIDAGRFVTADGKSLDVTKSFHGAIGAKTCGAGAGPRPATPDAVELRAILCEAVDRHLFGVVLTPNFNKPHHNHFHLEVMANTKWFLVH